MSVYIRTCTILAFQSGKEEIPRANFQLGKLKKWSVNWLLTEGENLQRSFQTKKMTQNQIAKPKV